MGKTVEEIEAELASLKQQRTKTKSNISRMKNYLDGLKDLPNSIELECRLEILNSYIKQLMAYQSEIEKLDNSDTKRAELEEICIKTKASVMSKMKMGRRESALHEMTLNESQIFAHRSTSYRLPALRIPKFGGKYCEYKNFIACFNQFVDNDPLLSKTEKFNYLVTSLTDDALRTVQAFQINEENYEHALKRLSERYDNKCLIFKNLISSLFEIAKLSKPSASGLRGIVDNVSAVLDSLSSLGTDKEITQSIIIHLVLSKVDSGSKSKWDEQLDYRELPSWTQCAELLIKRCQFLEINNDRSLQEDTQRNQISKNYKNQRNVSSYVISEPNANQCLYCSASHSIYSCSDFKNLQIEERFIFAKTNSLCINCLKKGHSVSKCKSSRCKVCQKPHNTLLHRFAIAANMVEIESQPSTSSQAASHLHMQIEERPQVLHSAGIEGQTMLATALIQIKNKSGNFVPARALLDSGSQVNFITKHIVQILALERKEKDLNIVGIGEGTARVREKVSSIIKSRLSNFEASLEFYVLPNISNFHPNKVVTRAELKIPNNLPLADPYFDKPQRVDLLLGVDVFFELMSVGQIKLGPNLPTLQKTLFGWIVSGRCNVKNNNSSQLSSMLSQVDQNGFESLEKLVTRFWEVEEIPQKPLLTEEQRLCESHFVKTTLRLPNGRFEVRLPFKLDPNKLGFSYEVAKRRFLSLERRLSKDDDLKQQYSAFMQEYLDLGHMSKISAITLKSPHYFIPHQCVLRPESVTTKLRVVFDASSKTTSQFSLNDLLMVGPTIQADLFSTLLRFRMRKYAISADISKMYRQIIVSNADRNFQLILWRETESEPLGIYKLNTVTYGTAPAPFMAIRCLQEVSTIFKTQYPLGAKIVANDFYVDDLLSGADTYDELKQIHHEVVTMLEACGFKLAKWYSNSDGYFRSIEEKCFQFNDLEATKTLGMNWKPKDDIFSFTLKDEFSKLKTTKRNILAISSKLFDPLGLLGPFVIKAKMMLQELWLAKINWDESVPMHLETMWASFKDNLLKVNNISIPRFVGCTRDARIQVHGFADASVRAYGCCLYIRSEYSNTVCVQLLTAKSKVAPLKTKTLPRLELCAAHLLAKLWKSIRNLFEIKIERVTLWTDSEIILHWLKTHPSSLSTFVGNRVADIQEVCDKVEWRHVPTSVNPADIISRGCDISELQESIWFTGPKFLHLPPGNWPLNKRFQLSTDQIQLEKRKSNQACLIATAPVENSVLEKIEKLSSYSKIIRVVAYMLRFIKSSRKKPIPNSRILHAFELENAFLKIIGIYQSIEFSDEINFIQNSKKLRPSIQKLSPFLQQYEDDGLKFTLLRVGGRLLNAQLPYDSRFPLLLGKKSLFVTLYLRHLHHGNCHAGAKILISLLRQKVWVVNAREVARKTVRQCIRCFKFKPILLNQIMGNLPKDRVVGARPFYICGVDFCGPVYTSYRIRGKAPYKTYIAVFVCFASKAVHLEAVSDLMTDSFLLCLRRFIGRRGLPSVLWCDNGKNFQGAANLLGGRCMSSEEERKLQEFSAAEGIEVKFIPPRAPHFGGLWEAAVKSAKHLLIRTTAGAHLTYEELATFLVDIEAILNSRPICPLTEDPSDGEALTPGHLLIGCPMKTVQPTSSELLRPTYLKRFRLICSLKEHFWRAWQEDYIRSLQVKTQWFNSSNNLIVGSLVMIHEDNLPPQKWSLGKVVAVDAGTDGKVRVAQVLAQGRIIKRAIHKLAPLPQSVTNEDDLQPAKEVQSCNRGGVASKHDT